MKTILQDKFLWVLRFDKGEDVIHELAALSEKQKIAAAVFSAIGACEEVILSYYNLEQKHYEDHTFSEDMEIVSVTGNIGSLEDKPVIHAHGVFAGKELTTRGGHIKKLVVSATCEVTLTVLSGALQRVYDQETGLNLLS